MDTRFIKIPIAAAAIIYTVYLFTRGSIGSGISMIFLSAILVLFVFRSARLILAMFRLRKQDFEGALKWLGRVNPEKLWKKQEAYYYFLNGSIDMGTNKIKQGERNYKKALSIGLRMDYDKAAAKMSLAMAAMAQNRRREAINLLNEAKRYDKRGMLKKDIKMIEQAMKKPQKVIRQRR